MKIRDTWLLEDLHSFDEPSDWTLSPELKPARPEPRDDEGFRSLLDDPEACSNWGNI